MLKKHDILDKPGWYVLLYGNLKESVKHWSIFICPNYFLVRSCVIPFYLLNIFTFTTALRGSDCKLVLIIQPEDVKRHSSLKLHSKTPRRCWSEQVTHTYNREKQKWTCPHLRTPALELVLSDDEFGYDAEDGCTLKHNINVTLHKGASHLINTHIKKNNPLTDSNKSFLHKYITDAPQILQLYMSFKFHSESTDHHVLYYPVAHLWWVDVVGHIHNSAVMVTKAFYFGHHRGLDASVGHLIRFLTNKDPAARKSTKHKKVWPKLHRSLTDRTKRNHKKTSTNPTKYAIINNCTTRLMIPTE